MRRRLLALIAVASLIFSTVSVPVIAQLGDIQVTLTCSDGIQIIQTDLVVDTETLAALASAVEAMTLYPAGQVCQLTQAPLLSASIAGGLFGPSVAFAQGNPKKDFVVGGGRFDNCLNFSVSAHSDNVNSVASTKGSITETLPQTALPSCPSPGHYKAQVVCLKVSGTMAFLSANYVESSGFFAPFGHVVAGFTDNGNPGPAGPVDRVSFSNLPGLASGAELLPTANCGAPVGANLISNGNVSVNDAP
jgi:hypothetical protein